jgi:lipid II:glycine glycyltransferase (peptidoglycan interpeptide bridge formation enzyme)
MIKLLLGCRDGNFVAASAALLYKQTIYGWYRGFNRDYSASLPNDQMVWHMLKWGAENGYQVFNFGGAGKPSEPYGPRSFKAKFGGRLVNYGRHVSIHHTGLFRVSRLAYEIGRYIL